MEREFTFGERAVGLTFNPSKDERVDLVKRAFAAIIDQCHEWRIDNEFDAEAHRCFSLAITDAQIAQMWTVKGLTMPRS